VDESADGGVGKRSRRAEEKRKGTGTGRTRFGKTGAAEGTEERIIKREGATAGGTENAIGRVQKTTAGKTDGREKSV